MRALGIIATVSLLVSTAIAEVSTSQALARIPTCTQECGDNVLIPAQCQLTDLSNCLCTNSTLQFEFARCVLELCDLADQFMSSTVLQNEICKGVPIPSRSRETIRGVIIVAAFTYVIIGLRFYSRALVTTKLWWDDYAIAVATILIIPMTIIPIISATCGFGRHFWDIPPQNLVIIRKFDYISQILYVIVQSLAKVSILLLYLRIFPSIQFRRVIKIAMAWMICHTIAFGLVTILQCVPLNLVWDLTVHGKCCNSQAFGCTLAGISIFEDFVIMLIPVWELKGLNLNLKKKIAVMFLFALGSFVCIISIIRLKYLFAYGRSIDVTYVNVDVTLWSVAEDCVAVICACLMCFRPLFIKFLPSLLPTTSLSEGKTTQSQAWVQVRRGSKLASKLGAGAKGYELHSQDDEGKDQQGKAIRVQKTWVTETSSAEALPESSYSMESLGESWKK